jgi:hypothetical protein
MQYNKIKKNSLTFMMIFEIYIRCIENIFNNPVFF